MEETNEHLKSPAKLVHAGKGSAMGSRLARMIFSDQTYHLNRLTQYDSMRPTIDHYGTDSEFKEEWQQ